ncbi:MAG TPA: glucuronate isomerase [Blastocatellia bacterium]
MADIHPFIHDDFLLNSEPARELYHTHAADQPILDYHCHLPPDDIASNRRFKDLFEIWLEGDHYKWRAMRANGIDERFCTGDASHYNKFMAWAATVPATLRNPLYHWTHLELMRYYGIDDLLDEKTAAAVWERANHALASDELTAIGILKKFKVVGLCTTDDPTDDLRAHKQIKYSVTGTRVYPAFRPDKALAIDDPEAFNAWVNALEAASNMEIWDLESFLAAIERRHDYFHSLGCRLSDHGLNYAYDDFCSEPEAGAIFLRARTQKETDPADQQRFAAFMMLFFGSLDYKKGWTKQLHLGAMRNANSRMTESVGPNSGFDSIGDWPQAIPLARYLDRLDNEGCLPKTIIYNLNPADNYCLASMIGNFQDGRLAGKVQFGSGWWFLDQKEGIEWQLNALSNVGLLSRFVGMLTDSRSFMSYPRHEYFRRVLCDMLGRDIIRGEIPNDLTMVGAMVKNICFNNAREYFGLVLD